MRRLRNVAILTGVTVVAAVALAVVLWSFPGGRSMLVTAGLRVVLWSRGMHLAGGDIRVGRDRIDIEDLRITDAHGELFASVRHVGIDLDFAGLLGRSDRRLGLRAISLDAPRVILIRHDDGSWNFQSLRGGGAAAAPSPGPSQSPPPAGPPWRLHVVVQRGVLQVEEPQARVGFARSLALDGIAAQLSLDQGATSSGSLAATLRTLAGQSPLHGALFEDDRVSFGRLTVDAPSVPVAPIVDALAPTPAFLVERGVAVVHLQAYTVGYAPNAQHDWHLSGDGDVRELRMRVRPLVVPLRDMVGHLHYQDGLLSSRSLDGSAAGVGVHAFGAIRLLGGIRLAFGIRQAGALERERLLFAFSRDKPVSGPFVAAIRVDGPVGDLHVGGAFETRDAAYAQALIRRLRGAVYYAAGHLTATGLDLASHGARVWAESDFDLSALPIATTTQLTADAPAAVVPLAANLAPDGAAQGFATITGPVGAPQLAGYAQLSNARAQTLRTFWSGDARRLALGPLLYRAPSGEVWARAALTRGSQGPYALSGEIVASHARLHVRGGRVSLADVSGVAASLPSLDTTLDGVGFVGGPGSGPDVAADATATSLRVAGVDLGDAAIVAGGSAGHVRVVRASLVGGAAHVQAHGDLLLAAPSRVSAARLWGQADADLSRLAPIAPGLRARGTVRGDFALALAGDGFALDAHATSDDASIAGVPVRAGSVVMENAGESTALVAGLSAAGSSLWAAGDLTRPRAGGEPTAQVAAFAPHLDAGALRTLGSPLGQGSVTGFAQISGPLSAPDVGAFATVRGIYRGTPLSGDVDVRYAGATVRSNASRISYAGSRATISGTAAGLFGLATIPSARLALDVSVRDGDLAGLDALGGSATPLTGGYDASVRIAGSAGEPSVDGVVATDLGTVRGVAFDDLRGRVHATAHGIALHQAAMRLGTSDFRLDGDLSPRSFHVKAASPHIDMSDFNDFFGGADVFAGVGRFDMDVASQAGALAWSGNFELNDAALRDYPVGYVDADFSSRRGALQAMVIQNGVVGASTLSARVRFRPTAAGLPDLRTATYRVQAALRNVDLAAALPLVREDDLGLTGLLDADGQMRGTLRNPIGTATIALHGARFRRVPIDALVARVASDARGVTLTSGDLTLPYLTAHAAGRYSFERGSLQGSARLDAADLSSVASAMRVPGALGGGATADVELSGTLARPLATAAVDASRATIYGIAFDSAKINAKYSPGQIAIGDTAVEFAGERGRLSFTGELPLQLHPLALGPKERPIDLSITADRIDLSVFDPITSRYASLAGNLNAAASIKGTAGDPVGKGTAQIRYASLRSPFDLIPLTDLTADIHFDRDTISLQRLTSDLGGGSVSLLGAAHIVPAEGLRSTAGLQFWSRLSMRRAQVDVPDWIRGTLDGDASITRSGVTPYVEGSIATSDAVIPFSAIYALATGGAAVKSQAPAQPPGVPALLPGHTIVYGGQVWGAGPAVTLSTIAQHGGPVPQPTGFALPAVDVKVALSAGNNVRVRGGNAIDLTTAGGLVVEGPLRSPTLEGQFYAVRGQVGYFDTNFRLVSGTVTFDPIAGFLPTMDVTAVTNAANAEITLHITGRVDNLQTDLSSNPSMSRDQIVATLLHAPQLAALTNSGAAPGQAQTTLTQTAQSFFNAQLTRSLLYPFESALAQQLNIESVSLIFDAQGNLAIEVRKRFTSSVAAVYQTTLRVPVTQSYGVSYRLRDYLSLDLIQAQPNLALPLPLTTYPTTTLNLRYQFH